MKSLIKYLMMPTLLFSLITACEKPKNVSINGSEYEVSGDNITQTKSSFLEDGVIKIGVVSDIEGAIENARNSAERLKKQNVDAVIIAGDVYENEGIRRNPVYPNSTDNLQEMFDGIEPYAQLNVPIFVISGNHEKRDIYDKGIKNLKEKYPNVFDINGKTVDLKEFNIVGMGGYHDPRFITRDGFLLKDSDYKKAFESLSKFQSQDIREPTVFVTHGPPRSRTRIDYVKGFGHVGDNKTKRIMNSELEGIINLHGHIHEGGGNSDKGNSSGISVNVASITDFIRNGANTGLLTIKNSRVGYQELK